MIKIDIISGFLGAGKTTLIKKLLKEALSDSKVVLIENEFGEIGIDGGFLREAGETGIEIREMNSGCICCSLVGDFDASLKEVIATYSPDRILIEPSGVGKLSDVIQAVLNVAPAQEQAAGQAQNDQDKTVLEVMLNSAVTVVDATKCRMYIKNFGEFFIDQISHSETIILSRTDKIGTDKLLKCVELLRGYNPDAVIVTTPWEQLEGRTILETMEKTRDLQKEMLTEMWQIQTQFGQHHSHDGNAPSAHGHEPHSAHEHHEQSENDTCSCHNHEHTEDDTCNCHSHEPHCAHEYHEQSEENTCGCHGHHPAHEDHTEDCPCGCHNHSHGHHLAHEHHAENCTCGCHVHDHHHADEIFHAFGLETPATYEKAEIENILTQLEDEATYGMVLRAKGMVPSKDDEWLYFDYVPGESNIRRGKADVTGKICVIGAKLREENLKALWGKEGKA